LLNMNMDFSNLKMIIFDIDGTLAETDDYYIEKGAGIANKVLPFVKPESIEKIVRYTVMFGETITHGFYRLLDLFGLDTMISKMHSKLSVKENYKYKEVKGMRETISLLHQKYVIGIITSGGHKSTNAFLKKFDLTEIIKYVVSAEDCKYIKPHPAPIFKIAENAGFLPENCMLVGDTIFDILCAKRAGAYSVAVKSGFDTERFLKWHKADLLVNTVNELPGILGMKEPIQKDKDELIDESDLQTARKDHIQTS